MTIEEAYQLIIDEKNTFSSLSGLEPSVDDRQALLGDLQSNVQVEEWRLWVHIIAVFSYLLSENQDEFKQEVQTIVDNNNYHTLEWIRERALEFQDDGALLKFVNGKYQYDPVNLSARPVKRCSTDEAGGNVIIKTATEIGGVLVPLSNSVHDVFKAYIRRLRGAGAKYVFINAPADNFIFFVKILYDPLILSATGESLANPGTYPVPQATKDFLSQIKFNGLLSVAFFAQKILGVPGVVDLSIIAAQYQYGSLPATDIAVSQKAYSGYWRIDTSIYDPLAPDESMSAGFLYNSAL